MAQVPFGEIGGVLAILPGKTMLLLENLRVRIREWNDQSEDPDLVPRFRRLWRAKADGPVPARPARPTAALVLAAADATRIRRAG